MTESDYMAKKVIVKDYLIFQLNACMYIIVA